ncbi:hypothetical protein [Pseudonocardia sp.]|uniref:hypothetical protein n=1 Tax=Pseudonocardia sp. TaxID=60912 RepID=UPI003D0DFBAF
MPKLLLPAVGAFALVAPSVAGPDGLPSSSDTAQTVVVAAAVAPLSADSNCHANYNPCLPRVHDLDCPDIGHRVTVVETDVYRLDADDDGTGCDRYPEPAAGR